MPETNAVTWATKAASLILPVTKGRVFAFGDTCVGALYYQGAYEGMHEVSLAALRADFDALRLTMSTVGRVQGWKVEGETDASLPFLRFSDYGHRDYVPLCVYPLDKVPRQSILRFKVLKEAGKSNTAAAYARLRRYEGIDTGFVANLFARSAQGVMGERTIQQRTIPMDSVFPLRTLVFEGLEVPAPAKLDSWVAEPTAGRTRITELIQEDGLDSLEEVKRVCAELNIPFFLVGGTMLGAIRHHGYIPWDDDIDIGMLRADYDRFVKEAPAVLNRKYFVQLPATDPHIHFVYARLRHKGVDYITRYNEDKQFDRGFWIDIFPFDVTPKNRSLAGVHNKLARLFARASMGLKRRKEYAAIDLADPTPVAPEDQRYLKVYGAVSRLFPVRLCDFGYRFVCKLPSVFLRRNRRYASFIPSYTTIEPGEVKPIEWVDFEGHQMPLLAGARNFLERQYGDYLALPPVHQRQTDHGLLRVELPSGEVVEP
jgi:lipopolysaccharide cholinephosphotransferase